MKRGSWTIVGVVIIAVIIGVTITQRLIHKESGVYKVGAVLPLTGSAAVWGENAKRGLDMALEEINDTGGVKGKKIQLIYEDSQSNSKVAISALRKLITAEDIQVVIGDIASSNVLAMAPIVENEKVVLLSPGASNPDISYAGDYIFRNWQSDALEGKIDADFAYNVLGWRKIAIFYVRNAYGLGLFEIFQKRFKELGGGIALEESFEQDAVDFRPQLTKIKSIKIDGIYMPGYPKEMAKVLKQAKELKVKYTFLSVQAFDDPEILKMAGEAAEGVIFSIPEPPDVSQPIVRNFRENYQGLYSVEPGVCSDTGYDALRIVAWAIKHGGFKSEDIKDQLYKVSDFPGAAGSTTFDNNGDVIKPFIFKIVRNGKLEFYSRGK